MRTVLPSTKNSGAQVYAVPLIPAPTLVTWVQSRRLVLRAMWKVVDCVVHDCTVYAM